MAEKKISGIRSAVEFVMTRILVISTVEFGNNGIASVIMNYYRAMEKADIQMDFLAGMGICGDVKNELEAEGCTVYEISRRPDVRGYMRQLRKIMEDGGYQVVHVHGNSATMAFEMIPAVQARIPVRICHSHNTSCKNQLIHRVLYPVFQKSYTQGFACGIKAGEWLFKKNPYTVIRNGIDTSRFSFSPGLRYEYRRKIGAGKRKVIGHVGYFDPVKNQEFLIDLAVRLKAESEKYLFLFIGEGKDMYRVREKADEYHILDSILFCGTVPDVYGYMAAMDLFVLPSLYEGFPVSLLEAQCSGLFCLASDRVSAEANVTGFVEFLPLDRPEAWIEKIQERCGSEKRPERSYQAADRLTASGYDISRNADILKNLYQTYAGA